MIKVKEKLSFRTNEKYYLYLEISGAPLRSVSFTARAFQNILVPSSFYCEKEEALSMVGLLELPGLFNDIEVEVACAQSGDSKSHATSFKINPTVMIGKSKSNWIINKTKCLKLLALKQHRISDNCVIDTKTIVPTTDGLILGGQLISSYDDLRIVVQNRFGQINSSEYFLSNRNQIERANDTSCQAKEKFTTRFSVVVDEIKPPFMIMAIDNATNTLVGYKVFRKEEWKALHRINVRNYTDAFVDQNYQNWFESHRVILSELESQRNHVFAYSPKFSVIVPLYKTPIKLFRDMANSVLGQSYGNWELILVNASPDDADLLTEVNSFCSKDQRITHLLLDKNYGITENTNVGINNATGDYISFFDHDDLLEPDILFEYASAISLNPETAMLYCDEDKLMLDSTFGNPTFKPDFNIDLLRDNNYICHLLTVKRSLIEKVGLSNSELDGAQDHAMSLKIAELGLPVHHVPKVLYHWRMTERSTAANSDSKPYATQAGILAVQQHLDRVGIDAVAENAHGRAFRYRVAYNNPEPYLVSLVTVTNSITDALSVIESFELLSKPPHEIIIVSGNASLIDACASLDLSNVIPVYCNDAESLPAKLNHGAKSASGDYIVFMHPQGKAFDTTSLEELAGLCSRDDVAISTPMILREDKTLISAGYSYIHGNIFPLGTDQYHEHPGYIFRTLSTYDVAASSALCMMIKRSIFNDVGGFNEDYRESYFDIDLCFRIKERNAGLIVYTQESKIVFPLSTIDNYDPRINDMGTLTDRIAFEKNWIEKISGCDEYFSENFSDNPIYASHFGLSDIAK